MIDPGQEETPAGPDCSPPGCTLAEPEAKISTFSPGRTAIPVSAPCSRTERSPAISLSPCWAERSNLYIRGCVGSCSCIGRAASEGASLHADKKSKMISGMCRSSIELHLLMELIRDFSFKQSPRWKILALLAPLHYILLILAYSWIW